MKNFLSFAKQLSQELSGALKNELPTHSNRLSCREASIAIKIAHRYMAMLKSEMDKYYQDGVSPFKDKSEETAFFKEIKPVFLSHLYYYTGIFEILIKWPAGPVKTVRTYLKTELERIHFYFLSNRELYIHHRNGSNWLDDFFFRRTDLETKLAMGYCVVGADENFSTGFDNRLAKIIANEKLQVFLESELSRINNSSDCQPASIEPQNKMSWTESKTSLVELIYALHHSGALNSGKASVKDIAALFENIFSISLGDYYRTYLEIRMRKKGYTPFLVSMKNVLDKKIEESFQD